jgi:Tfp pilus assembly protein PilF
MSGKSQKPVPFLVALVVLFAATAARGQTTDGNLIIGKVRAESGRPLANLIVELQTGNGAPVTVTVTSNEGDYAFSGLTGASFVIVVNDPGYQPVSERVELTRSGNSRPGESVHVDIVLVPKKNASGSAAGSVFHQEVPEPALQAYRRGVRLIAEQKRDEGVNALREAIGIFPQYFDAHFALGLELFRVKRYQESIEELERARVVNPRDGRLYQTFGLVLFQQKNYAMSARVFEEATRLDPTNAQAFLMLGASLIETGNLDGAERGLKRADQVSSHSIPIVHIHLARVYEKRGDRRRAAEELEEYLRKNPRADNAPAIREAIKKLKTHT